MVVLFPLNAYSDQTQTTDIKLLVLGDSLSAAYGMKQEQGWVNLLRNEWQHHSPNIVVVNGAISGDTTDSGLARLPRLLTQHSPSHLLIELGGNDGLQGHNVNKISSNLLTMIEMAKEQDITVFLQAMRIPPNYGKRYTTLFEAVYTDLAEQESIPLIPFMLETIARKPELMQRDGIHPTIEAQSIIALFMKEKLTPLLLSD